VEFWNRHGILGVLGDLSTKLNPKNIFPFLSHFLLIVRGVEMSIKCRKCGFENPPNFKFCGNCGEKLAETEVAPKFEGLALLHITASIYLIVSLIFNAVVQASPAFITPYVLSALLGLYAGYRFYQAKTSKHLIVISAIAIILGLASTLSLFLIGLGIRGVIGPAWTIFLINAWTLWKARKKL